MNKNELKTLADVREHVLYAGASLTGKTTLARFHARVLANAGYDVVVYDPVLTATAGGGWPESAVMFDDSEKLIDYLQKLEGDPERPTFAFVDEAADVFSHSQTENIYLPRRIRHQHVYMRIVSQRPTMIHPHVRTQCSFAYVLRLAKNDMVLILADFGHSGDAVEPLDKGDVLLLESGRADIETFNVFRLVDRHSPRKG